jgi:hypothetical protein
MAKKQTPETPDRPYAMPEVRVGDTVLWHDSQDEPPTAMALVTAVGNDNVTLAVLGPGYHNFLVKEGVRHQGHPDRPLVAAAEVGVWTHAPQYRRLLERVEALERFVSEFTGK